MKKILSFLILISFIITNFCFIADASNDEWFFVVTAYYSPLPNQEHYSFSVYNGRERTFEEEKRLQWEWIRWASWKAVFSWMLAAPKDYKFWTKIYLDWLGIWEVADRWGAIVSKWVRWYSYDRIDVWMWYWDEWLKRASNWWKRTIKWNIIDSTNLVNLDYWKISTKELAYTLNTTKADNVKSNNILNKAIIKDNVIDIFSKQAVTVDEIKKLQEKLAEIDLYSWEITWIYDDIIDVIYNFQLSKEIVKSEYDLWAWFYWPKTRLALKNEYNTYLIKEEEKKKELARLEEIRKEEEKKKQELLVKYKKIEELAYKKAEEKINFIWTPKIWDTSHSVRELQVTLKDLWYFKNKDTAIYWNITKESILSYQLDKKIISSKTELWAWIIWPKTSESLLNDLKNKFLEENIKNENIDLTELSGLISNPI